MMLQYSSYLSLHEFLILQHLYHKIYIVWFHNYPVPKIRHSILQNNNYIKKLFFYSYSIVDMDKYYNATEAHSCIDIESKI